MADDRLGVVKLQDGDDDELFAIVLVSGAVNRKNYMMNSSQRPLSESRCNGGLWRRAAAACSRERPVLAAFDAASHANSASIYEISRGADAWHSPRPI